jgi:roadblock/LC7 domain-containing protein
MSDLNSLSELKGVVATLRFYDDGTLAEAAGQLDRIDTQLAAELCHANGRIMHHGSDMLMTLSSDTGGWPPRGWMMMGDELSICAVAEVACFVLNREASFNDVFRSLSEISRK